MVKIREVHHIGEADNLDVDRWLARMAGNVDLPAELLPPLRRACLLSYDVEVQARKAGTIWREGISSFLTGLEMAEILAHLGLADEGLLAAILYRPVREGNLTLATVKKQFGAGVSALIESVLRMAVITTMRNDSEQEVFGFDADRQVSKIREMLVSIIDDVRVALIKLAERTCAIRSLKAAPEEKRLRVAREVFDIYAPLAHRLGIGYLKWELEDLAFRYLEPIEYKRIARLLAERRADRQVYIDEVMDTLRDELQRVGIEGNVSGRAKHIYSIWKKMQRKSISFSKVYDIRAVRVLVPTVADCYTLLGIVHSKWRNISEEFDDYIASPKDNGYRSLHTAVVGPRNRIVEIQIRTFEMHDEAEFGVCAHWQYKGSDVLADESYESKIAWLRQVLEWHDEIGSQDVKELLSHEGSPDRIYAFTPDGHVVDLPPASTPLDFAYRVHTEIGHRCRGAKINGRIVPLNTPLRTADQVEILTGKQEAPSRDWLSPSLGYVRTTRARAKVQQWFRKQNREKNIDAGRAMLEREFRQLALRQVDLAALAEKFNKHGNDGLYAAVGAGDVSVEQVVRSARVQFGDVGGPSLPSRRKRSQASRFGKSRFYIYGVGDLITRIARCCNPVPGDEISGFITSGRGVTIHRKDCGSLLRMKSSQPERILQVSWGGAPTNVYPVPLRITAWDRSGLLSDITSAVDKAGLFIDSMHSGETKAGMTDTRVTVEVSDIDQLRTLLSRIRQIPNVVDVERLSE